MDTVSRATLASQSHPRTRMWCHHSASAVSKATPRATMTPAQATARAKWAWLATLAPPSPPSVWAGRARKRASETRHPEDGERRGGRREYTEWCECEWRTKKSLLRKRSTSLIYVREVAPELGGWEDVEQRRRCGWDGVNNHLRVSERS